MMINANNVHTTMAYQMLLEARGKSDLHGTCVVKNFSDTAAVKVRSTTRLLGGYVNIGTVTM